MFEVLEVYEGWGKDVEQVVAQLAVAGLLVGDFSGEAPHGIGLGCQRRRDRRMRMRRRRRVAGRAGCGTPVPTRGRCL